MASRWFGYFYNNNNATAESESAEDFGEIPEAPEIPEEQKKKRGIIAMNCIRQYIITRNKNLRRLHVIVAEKIRQQLEDTTNMFGKSDLVCHLESMVASSEVSDDIRELSDKEWTALVDHIFEVYDMLVIFYKADHHVLTLSIPDPYNATEEDQDPLLVLLRENIRKHDLKRTQDISKYTADLYEYIISNIYDVARRHGSNEYMADLNNVHKNMKGWETRWDDAHRLTCNEKKIIENDLKDSLLEDGFHTEVIAWKYQIYIKWNTPDHIWDYDEKTGEWTQRK